MPRVVDAARVGETDSSCVRYQEERRSWNVVSVHLDCLS